jgi:hypothetical protein
MSDFIYRFEGVEITDGWQHPLDSDLVLTNANKWLGSQCDEKLEALQITKHERPAQPPYDSYYQKLVKQPSGEYTVQDLPLAEVKQKKKQELNDIRARKNREGFMFQDKLIQTDENSFFNIVSAHGKALAAKYLNEPFSTEWTTADNTTIQIDADAMLDMHNKLVEMGEANHIQCKVMKAQVDSPSCDTGAKVKAIVWP